MKIPSEALAPGLVSIGSLIFSYYRSPTSKMETKIKTKPLSSQRFKKQVFTVSQNQKP